MKMIKNNEKYNKWYYGYIDGINLSSIEWKKFNYDELESFLYQNYYDEDYESFVMERDMNNNFLPFGMTYLTFNNENIYDEYIVGLVKNNLGLYTIIACMIFNYKYLVKYGCIELVSYIKTVDTNKFFDINKDILVTLGYEIMEEYLEKLRGSQVKKKVLQ